MSELQKFVLEVLDGRRIHDGSVRKFDMFSSILETHLAWWPLCYIFAVLGAPNGIRVGAAKGQSCPPRPTLSLETCTEDDSEVLENETKREDADS